jgi:hypothetical protein
LSQRAGKQTEGQIRSEFQKISGQTFDHLNLPA